MRVLAMARGSSYTWLPMSPRTSRGKDGLIAQFEERGVWQGKATVYGARANRKNLPQNLTLESFPPRYWDFRRSLNASMLFRSIAH